MTDHASAPCRRCGGRAYATDQRCPHCGAALPPDHPAPPGWSRDAAGRIVYRIRVDVEVGARDGKAFGIVREAVNGEPTGDVGLYQGVLGDGPPGASGPATDPRDRPADLPRRVRPEGEGDG